MRDYRYNLLIALLIMFAAEAMYSRAIWRTLAKRSSAQCEELVRIVESKEVVISNLFEQAKMLDSNFWALAIPASNNAVFIMRMEEKINEVLRTYTNSFDTGTTFLQPR